MNKIIAIVGILSTLILTGCDPEIYYSDDSGNYHSLITFNEDDNPKVIGFSTIESNDSITVIINLKKNK